MFFGNSEERPPSIPRNWPNPTEEDLNERPKRIINISSSQDYYFSSNFVKTSKYEFWSFLPKFLLEEFNPKTKVANCYFLLISALQCIPQISNTSGYPTTMIPLIGVVFVDGILQIYEDLARHKADKEANASIAKKYDHVLQDFVESRWYEIEVGNIIKINSRETIPADIVIFAVAEKSQPCQGISYVETKSLDGETNLKLRYALPCTLSKVNDTTNFTILKGTIEMEHPNKLIDSFSGIIDLGVLGREPILSTNLLLRGCVLRNTDWVIGLVINTGHDTKIMMGNSETKPKTSFLESQASIEIQRIIILLAFVCFWGATGQAIWNDQNNISGIWYLNWSGDSISNWFIQFFYFFLLHASFIPVSLYVSMSLVRFFQAYFMSNDLDMYHEATDTPAYVRTMTLNEELGQISHIFTDKTGTLTCNVMDFRKMSVNGIGYGVGITEIGKAAWKLQGKEVPAEMLEGDAMAKLKSVPHVAFYDTKYDRDIGAGGIQKQKIKEFFRILAICHDVIPERVDGMIKLSASNPDDEALVCAAKYFGYEFCDRREKKTILKNLETESFEEVQVLDTIEFTSKRKKMSVIIRDCDGVIRLYTKGADTAMMPLFKAGQNSLLKKTDTDMRQYAIEGLRCLMVGYAVISEDRYLNWSADYHAACAEMEQIEKKKQGKRNKIEEFEDIIERDFILVGATAIEDRLQDGVPEAIAELAAAGINIWVLTGDKEETAINIAVACNVVLPKQYMDQIVINQSIAESKEAIRKVFHAEIKKFDEDFENLGAATMKPRSLIIDGPTLLTAMLDVEDGGCRELLLDFSNRCKCVVGCRVSPDQKREMVHLVKTGVPGVRTLAIGDGANDVPMIQEAHIGVGIRGEEGLQAANSSDFAIAQFRFLSQLVLKHGRLNYIRMCGLVCFMFYKNILMSIAQFWFNFNCAFSGTKYYTEGAIQMFNLLYTSLPILLYAAYDVDIKPKLIHQNPQLYHTCIDNEYFKPGIFWSWIVSAIIESILMSVVPMYTLTNSQLGFGLENTHWESGAVCYTVVVIVVNAKIFFMQTKWHYYHYLVIALSVGLWFTSAFFITFVIFFDYDWYMIFNYMTQNPSFWLTVILITTAIVGKDLYLSGLERNFNYKPFHILQEIEVRETQNPGLDVFAYSNAGKDKVHVEMTTTKSSDNDIRMPSYTS